MGQALWSDILGRPGFTRTIDDKVYSNFTYSSVASIQGASSRIDPFD
jgi:hypothetical protein